MSANKFKIGDKVKVRKGLVTNKYYDTVRCADSMARMGEKVLTIDCVETDYYRVAESIFCWSDEMLESAEKTLDNLCAGDFIGRGDTARRVLAVIGDCYLLSVAKKYTAADEWYTASELAEYGFKPIDRENTIEIDGKKYRKADVEKAIKDLEVVDYIM